MTAVSVSFADLANERISTSRGSLLAAFAYVVETAGRRRVTDLHVRRLLCYVRAHDRYYTGVPRSFAQLAKKLVLSVPTCRRVIRRAVEEFNLLIVIPQRHVPGGQTVNRYTINWDNVDALLYDADNTNQPSVTTDQPPSAQLESSYSLNAYSLQPNSPNNLSDIIEARILNSHPRLLRLPESLINSLAQDWPYSVRRFPRETPKPLLAHFDVILAKLQTATDCAQQINASKIYDRLQTLRHKLEAVHYRASHAAMCRTNLPPIDPIPEPTWDAPPFDLSSRSLDMDKAHPFDCSQFDFSWLTEKTPALSNQAPVQTCASAARTDATLLCDHPPVRLAPAHTSDQPPNSESDSSQASSNLPVQFEPLESACSASSAVKSSSALSSCSLTPEVCNLLIALAELITALDSAVECASDYEIAWLQNRFTNFRRHIKTLRRVTHVLNATRHPCPEPVYSQTSLDLPTA